MKTSHWLAIGTLALALAPAAQASEDRGDRVDHRLDRRGDHIEARYDRRAERAAENGHPKRATWLERKGNRVDARLDRRGDRFDRRFDRRHR
jgi:hypothetical protein